MARLRGGLSRRRRPLAGRIREATLSWMWQQADAAHAKGKQVVVSMPPTLLPDTPEETGSLLMRHMGPLLAELYLMSVTGNENEDPRSTVITDEIEASMGTLLQEAVMGKVTEEMSGVYVFLLQGMAMAYLKPYLMSMVTDTNQYSSDLRRSVTNDIDVVLTLPGALE